MSSYPININEIREKVNLRKVRNKYIESKQISLDFPTQITNVKDEVNRFGEKVIRVDGEIPVNLPVKNEDRFLFISYDQSVLTHGLHKYPAKFFPELPRWLIKRYSNEYDTVLDPFCGSGTTNVEALLNKRHSVGIDVDPFSRYLSRVKTTPLNENELDDSCSILLKEIIDFKPSLVKAEILDFPYRDQWFNEEIVLELAYIKEKIENLDFGGDIKDFYRICFSSIIRSVSNADDNCTRTVIRKKLNKQVYPADALTKFVESILIKVPKMKEFSNKYPKDIRVAFPEDNDARKILYPDNSFELAVTSPPYANAVDYPRTHQLEIYWLELAHGSLTPLKRKHVGTESVKVGEYKTLHNIGIPEADEAIYNIYQKDPRRAYIGYKYLFDMQENLKEVYRVLKPEGRYIIVVGNNKIRGEVFKNWLYLMKMSERIGFNLESFFASEIIKHFIKVPREERIDTDWVLVLKK
jgi:DNA modification methylase